MTLTFDPEVGSMSLHTFYTFWVKYEQDWVNWTQNLLQICDVGQMDNYAMLTEQCLNNYGRSFNYIVWLIVLKENKICKY